jgi:hypothetical protein
MAFGLEVLCGFGILAFGLISIAIHVLDRRDATRVSTRIQSVPFGAVIGVFVATLGRLGTWSSFSQFGLEMLYGVLGGAGVAIIYALLVKQSRYGP